jgi:hypothetical protein
MLRNLVRKDLILNGKVFISLLWLVVWIAYSARQLDGVAMATVLGGIAATLMTVTLGTREEKFHAAAITYSLPVARRTIVQHRYLLGHVIGVVSFLFCSVLVVVVPWSRHTSAEVFDPKTVLFGLASVSLTMAVGLPLVLRLGVMGLFAGLAGLQVMGLVALVAGVLAGSAFSLRPVFRAAERAIIGMHQGLGSAGTAVEILVAVALLTWLSYRLSLFLVERRDV